MSNANQGDGPGKMVGNILQAPPAPRLPFANWQFGITLCGIPLHTAICISEMILELLIGLRCTNHHLGRDEPDTRGTGLVSL